jgi:hypothetical protein
VTVSRLGLDASEGSEVKSVAAVLALAEIVVLDDDDESVNGDGGELWLPLGKAVSAQV